MTNTALLQQAIDDSGMKINAILSKMNIKAYATLRAKIENEREFTASEMKKLSEILNLSAEQFEAIFFANDAESHSA